MTSAGGERGKYCRNLRAPDHRQIRHWNPMRWRRVKPRLYRQFIPPATEASLSRTRN